MTSKTLTKLRRKNCDVMTKSFSLGSIKDSLITQTQPFINQEIVDLDLPLDDPVTVTLYLKKGQSKTRD